MIGPRHFGCVEPGQDQTALESRDDHHDQSRSIHHVGDAGRHRDRAHLPAHAVAL